MNILVIGSGGREHALSWKLSQSPQCDKLFIAPGNAGTQNLGTNVALGVNDFDGIAKLVLDENISLVVVGPEEPLVKGIRDYFAADERLSAVPLLGPGAEGARLEGSKDYSKAFMQRHNIPTATARTFDKSQIEAGYTFLASMSAPYVLKADGLAAGKGVIIAQSLDEAKEALHSMLVDEQFGEASAQVLIEQFLDGIELSVFVLTDGKDYLILPEAKDYKRIGDGDTGPNTGGMGAVSPVSFAQGDFLRKVEERVVKPTVDGLHKDKIDYRGFLFIGLMNVGGDPFVIEYNVRMGDPETQVVMPRIQSDLAELFLAAAKGELAGKSISLDPRTATTVVQVAGGYPGSYGKGMEISGLDKSSPAQVFHAGTKADGDKVVTAGGRVLAHTGMGSNLQEALDKSYASIGQVSWQDHNYRKDIGQDLLKLAH